MYLVLFRERPDSEPITVHTPFDNGFKLTSGSINQDINSIDSFDLELDYMNPGYNHIQPLQTLVEVRNAKNNFLEFSGRIVNYADTMGSDGVHTKSVICEGALGYLHDSSQPYIDYSGSPENLFTQMINNHNSQVESYKQFKIGTISLKTTVDRDGTVRSVNDGILTQNTICFITPEDTTFEQIKSNLLDVYGGEMQVRVDGASRYIDWVRSIGHDSQEDITLSRNLRSVTKKVDPSSIVSRLIPLGKTITTTTEGDNEKRTTIESVNDGLNYIDRADLIAAFGVQTGSYTWDTEGNATTLKNNAIAWLNAQKVVLEQFTVEALDLFKIGKGLEEYIVGNTHMIVNPIMTLNERIRVVAKTVDIVDPVNSTLTIGDKFKTLIDYQTEQRNASKNYNKLQTLVNQQKATILALNDQLTQVQTTLTNTSVSTLPSDLASINAQLQQIQDTINGLPTYDLATSTTDGLMAKEDKVKMDTITVVNPVDLDNLVARVTALENPTP